jgi:hypothetical protein
MVNWSSGISRRSSILSTFTSASNSTSEMASADGVMKLFRKHGQFPLSRDPGDLLGSIGRF